MLAILSKGSNSQQGENPSLFVILKSCLTAEMPRNKTADDTKASEKKVHKDSSEKLYDLRSETVKYSGYPIDRLANCYFDPKRLEGSLEKLVEKSPVSRNAERPEREKSPGYAVSDPGHILPEEVSLADPLQERPRWRHPRPMHLSVQRPGKKWVLNSPVRCRAKLACRMR